MAIFLDLEKAFDHVDRTLLFYKLRKLYDTIKTLYTSCKSAVNINGYLTDWFSTEYGVCQGDDLSPTSFGLYINDLSSDLQKCNNVI